MIQLDAFLTAHHREQDTCMEVYYKDKFLGLYKPPLNSYENMTGVLGALEVVIAVEDQIVIG